MGLFAREFLGESLGLPPLGLAGIVARVANKKLFNGKKKKVGPTPDQTVFTYNRPPPVGSKPVAPTRYDKL